MKRTNESSCSVKKAKVIKWNFRQILIYEHDNRQTHSVNTLNNYLCLKIEDGDSRKEGKFGFAVDDLKHLSFG